jgi:hypothetical protein
VREEIEYFAQKLKAFRPSFAPPRPFKVIFHLRAPLALSHPWLAFDGIIAHLCLLEALGDDFFITPKKLNLLSYLSLPLPLKRTEDVYHASVSIFPTEVSLKLTYLYKRFEPNFASSLRKKKVDIGRGHFRDFKLSRPYIPVPEVTFYACGDVEYIGGLLEGLVGLGDDVRVGFGIISKYEVEELSEDYSLVKDGQAMRPIPISMCEEFEAKVPLAYKPPYWDPQNVALCVPPGARCVLRKNSVS